MHTRLRLKWAVCIIIGTLIVATVIMLITMLNSSHQNTYTNAWYVYGYE